MNKNLILLSMVSLLVLAACTPNTTSISMPELSTPTNLPASPVPTRTLTPSPTVTPDLDATNEALWQATLQAGQTQNAFYEATRSAIQTDVNQARSLTATTHYKQTEISLALTPTPVVTPLPNPTPGVITWKQTISIPKPSSASLHIPQGNQLVSHNGFIYVFGGRGADGDEILTDVYFSAVKPDGPLGEWQETTPLPGKYVDHHEVVIGNYIYMITGAAGAEAVFFVPLNADGTLGAWKRTADLSPSRQTYAVASYGNFIYAVGGNSGGTWDRVQFTSAREDGSLNPWADTTPLPVALQEQTAIVAAGYLYVFGGIRENGQISTTVYNSAIQPNGTLSGWETTTPLPVPLHGYTTIESDGYIYLFGGPNATYFTRILPDHTLDTWEKAVGAPTVRQGLRVGANNGFVYVIGGRDATRAYNTVYFGWIGSQAPVEIPIVQHPDCTSGWTRLEAGGRAQVTADNPLPNRVRAGPSTSFVVVGLIYPGTVVNILEGPVCADGLVFWRVESGVIPGGEGWTAEGDGTEYWLEPVAP